MSQSSSAASGVQRAMDSIVFQRNAFFQSSTLVIGWSSRTWGLTQWVQHPASMGCQNQSAITSCRNCSGESDYVQLCNCLSQRYFVCVRVSCWMKALKFFTNLFLLFNSFISRIYIAFLKEIQCRTLPVQPWWCQWSSRSFENVDELSLGNRRVFPVGDHCRENI